MNFRSIIKTTGIVVGAAAAGWYFCVVRHTGKKVADKLCETFDEIVTEEKLDAAVAKAADIHMDVRVQQAADRASDSISYSIKRQMTDIVNAKWEQMKGEIESDILKRVGYIDPGEIKQEAVTKAKEEWLDQVHDEVERALNDLRDKYDEKIDEYMDRAEDRFDDKIDDILEGIEDEYGERILEAIRKDFDEED